MSISGQTSHSSYSSPSRKAVIEFKNYSFQYRAQSEPTLHDISLTIFEGEKVLIVGPSGSGKSTIAHCINGLVPYFYLGESRGSASIMGEELASLSLHKLSERVGTVLQDPDGQFVGLTVAEDIAFKMENEGIPQRDMVAKVIEAARAVDIHTHLDSSPHELSGGQKQRTSLAGVLASEVDILLFDEPLANLDPVAGNNAIELIDRIHRETGKTVIIVEHRLEEVLHRNVDRVIVVGEGRIVADLKPEELLSSELLRSMGIREPLYLTALKYAGCKISPEMIPQDLSKISLDECLTPLTTWYENVDRGYLPVERSPIIEFQDVNFAYEMDKPILRNVSFQVGMGEMLSIVGHNGAGKSTLSKLVCGFHKPTSGRILYKGRGLENDTIKERAEYIGFVMQNPNHMISKTLLYDEVALGLTLRGIKEEDIRDRVHAVLKVCGLFAFRNWPISALSFGQKKRVTIASILVLNPEVMILDEPTAGQDFKHYNEMMEFLLDLKNQGMSIIIITHDMHLIMEYAERTIVLVEGEVIADDLPANVLTDDRIMDAANLKETSLYALGVRAGIDQPREFVRRFIEHDRRERIR